MLKSEPNSVKPQLQQTLNSLSNNLTDMQRKAKIGCALLKNRLKTAQEAAFTVLQLPLIKKSRTVVHVNSKPPAKRYRQLIPKRQLDSLPPNSTEIFQKNLIDYYRDRPTCLENMSLFRFAQNYAKVSGTPSAKAKNQVIKLNTMDVYFRQVNRLQVVRTPRIPTNTEDYYYSLILLAYPHRTEQDLTQGYASIIEAFLAKHDNFDKELFLSNTYVADTIGQTLAHINSISLESAQQEMANTNSSRHNDISQAYITALLNEQGTATSIASDIDTMTPSQRAVFNHVATYNYTGPRPLRLYCTGVGGTGKTFLIRLLTKYLNVRFGKNEASGIVKLAALTGTASQQINGQTLHSLLSLRLSNSRGSSHGLLNGASLNKLRLQWKHVKFLIIDEISLVSSQTLTDVNNRLIDIMPQNDYFGGINILIFGDPFQIKPVMGKFFFENEILWPLFTQFELKENVRQKNDTAYAQLLNRVRVGRPTEQDIVNLCSRLRPHPPPDFAHAIYLFPDNDLVNEHNAHEQKKLTSPIHIINANHYYTGITKSHGKRVEPHHIPEKDKEAGGLLATLHVSVGTRVLLNHNLDVKHNLCNGAMGTVTFIEIDSVSREPVQIHVKFDNPNIGQMLPSGTRMSVPIARLNTEYMIDGTSVVRRMFPLQPAWAITFHRAQGATYQRAVIYLGPQVFQAQMAYVALSRVQSLNGLILTELDLSVLKPFPIVADLFNGTDLYNSTN